MLSFGPFQRGKCLTAWMSNSESQWDLTLLWSQKFVQFLEEPESAPAKFPFPRYQLCCALSKVMPPRREHLFFMEGFPSFWTLQGVCNNLEIVY